MKGSVNLSVYHLYIMHIYKQIHPILYMEKITMLFSIRRIVIKRFCSVFDVLNGPLDNAFLKWRINMMI